jgi:HSP20 family protein
MRDPWQEMRRLQREMEYFLSDFTPASRWPLTGEYPPINLTRGEKDISLAALSPGADRASLDVSVVGETVTIRGERRAEPGVSDEQYHRRERPIGTFTRSLSLGDRLDPDRTQATYTNGVLKVQLARVPEATPKKIPIQA